MKILSHRGYWKKLAEKNQEAAFIRSFELGFGTETDVRDADGKLLISHDPPNGNEICFSKMLEIHSEIDSSLPLALNVKADGLQQLSAELIRHYSVPEYFSSICRCLICSATTRLGCAFSPAGVNWSPSLRCLLSHLECGWISSIQTGSPRASLLHTSSRENRFASYPQTSTNAIPETSGTPLPPGNAARTRG